MRRYVRNNPLFKTWGEWYDYGNALCEKFAKISTVYEKYAGDSTAYEFIYGIPLGKNPEPIGRQAIEAFCKSIELNPNNDFVFYKLGSLYHRLKEYSAAVVAFSKAIELNPNFEEAYLGRAEAYAALKELQLAAKDHETAEPLRLERQFHEMMNLRTELRSSGLGLPMFTADELLTLKELAADNDYYAAAYDFVIDCDQASNLTEKQWAWIWEIKIELEDMS